MIREALAIAGDLGGAIVLALAIAVAWWVLRAALTWERD